MFLSSCSLQIHFILIFSILISITLNAPIPKSQLTVAFGSCNRQYLENPIFQKILDIEPSVYIWGGDAAYVDTRLGPGNFVPPTPEEHKSRLDQVYYHPIYSKIREKIPIYGVWDDHDYGLNNAGADLPIKYDSRKLFLEFLDVDENSPRRNSSHGTSDVIWIRNGNITAAIVLIDVRWGMTSENIFYPEFWDWFDSQIQYISSQNPTVVLFVTGIQLVPTARSTRGVGRFKQEMFENWPHEKKLFIEILRKHSLRRAIVLSGDVHFGELTLDGCDSESNDNHLEYPLLELTSSGQTHTWGSMLGNWLAKFALNYIVPHEKRLLGPVVNFNFGTVSIHKDNLLLALWGPESGPESDIPRDMLLGEIDYYPTLHHVIPLSLLQPGSKEIQQYCKINQTQSSPLFPFEVIFVLLIMVPLILLCFAVYVFCLFFCPGYLKNTIYALIWRRPPKKILEEKKTFSSALGGIKLKDPEFKIYKN